MTDARRKALWPNSPRHANAKADRGGYKISAAVFLVSERKKKIDAIFLTPLAKKLYNDVAKK
jgi:hypothetical protein